MPIITVENLSKRYLIGHRTGRNGLDHHVTFRDVLARGFRNAARKAADVLHGRQVVQGDAIEEFWALKDASFEVKEGEIVGIIGRNGAGKSTLLKILSRITEPTSGRVTLRGRVASLLEVGTGFHPELSGRENVYLNGAILGMNRAEIRKKFDEIVTFAEIEKFIDTPVKRYSSGMYVRLAFAVAAHLEPEILIVDEVLAVGDFEFQKKCLGKMSEVARQHRTVLFVSHNIGAVKTLTERCILLEQGRIAAWGNSEVIIAKYLAQDSGEGDVPLRCKDLEFFRRNWVDGAPAKITAIGLSGADGGGEFLPQIQLGAKITIEIQLDIYRSMTAADLGIVVKTSQGEPVTSLIASDRLPGFSFEPGRHVVKVAIGDLPLVPGRYSVVVSLDPIVGSAACDVIHDYPLISVVNTGNQVDFWPTRPRGVVQCQAVDWEASEQEANE
jgi:homopolymeric O-antigen transport system ATP-binding protein